MGTTNRAYEVVLDHIEDAILDGSLTVGQLLPPERDLAVDLGVSRSAVREAIHALVAQGVLSSSVGPHGGTRVAAMRAQALTKFLRLQMALAEFPIHDITEVRVALERTAVMAACRDISAETLDDIREVLETMRMMPDIKRFNQLDAQFHILVAHAGANELATDMTVAIRESVRQPILRAEDTLEDWETFRRRLMEQHDAIYRALENRDPQAGAAAMEEHIRDSYDTLLT